MKFKTTIEIIADATSKDEALELAGEYLSGNIASGVDMKCDAKKIYAVSCKSVVLAIALIAVLFGGLTAVTLRPSHNMTSSPAGLSAVQPPLKTSDKALASSEFKKDWQSKQDKEAINLIKSLR